ncbi:MAG: von Willebrand factor type A domain-containing protein [Mucinivorans sp.]
MKRLPFLLLAILVALGLLVTLVALGTNASEIKGKIILSENGLPLPGATIMVKGTTRGTASNAEGLFKIQADNGQILEIRYVGMKHQDITVFDSLPQPLVITMEPEAFEIQSLAASAPGVTRESKTIGDATTSTQSNKMRRPAKDAVVSECLVQKPEAEEMQFFDDFDGAALSQASYSTHSYNRDRAVETEKYAHRKANAFISVDKEPLSTFAMEVDVASYTNCKRIIESGKLPEADAVRVEEFLNYFSYNLPQPTNADPVKITTEMSACPWNNDHKLVRVGVKARQMDTENIPASNFVFLVDVSGSMYSELDLVKSSLKLLVNNLRSTDRVAIVVYAGAAGTVLGSTPGTDKQKILASLESLTSGGSTAGGAGIQLAYKVARNNFIQGGNNRIILCSDGDFNVGVSSNEELLKLVKTERKSSNVFMTVLGFGRGNYRDDFMQTIAEKGNGNMAYINSMQDANKTLAQEFGSSMYNVAKDVKMQVEFNHAYVKEYRLLGYESRLLEAEDFNNDKIDAGEMGAGHAVTALYELVPVGGKSARNVDELRYQKENKQEVTAQTEPKGEMMFVKVRYKDPEGGVSKLITATVLSNSLVGKPSADHNFASAVAMFAQKLSDSECMESVSYDDILDCARSAYGDDKHGYRREFVRLVEAAGGLAK